MKQKNYNSIMRSAITIVLTTILLMTMQKTVFAQSDDVQQKSSSVYSVTGLPLPRFVSLSKAVVNVRTGPGQEYPIKFVLKKIGLPVEIIREYDHWRMIRDHEGSEGWVYKSLLSWKRTALVMGESNVPAYIRNPEGNTRKTGVSMMLEPMSMVDVEECYGSFCYVKASGLSGWIERKSLWGVYETEKFD